ncbi:MAG: DUF4158 domain-containing protein, partial [Symploca sp. SIO1C4]|nr:DUF4158 domain-containing protein [Symploca sp. SIO1C4]
MVKPNWDTEELIDNWTLLPQEIELVSNKVGANQIGFAVLLKYFQLMARFPDSPKEIPKIIISYIAQQLKIPEVIYSEYNWLGRSISNHRASIRKLFGFRTATIADGEEIVNWLKAEIIQRLGTRAERRINKELVNDFKQVTGKTNILFRLAEVALASPLGVIEKVIYPVVSQKTLSDLVAEYKSTGLAYRQRVYTVMRASFASHYRRMIPQLLEMLEFRSNNEMHRPVIQALELLKKYSQSQGRYYTPGEE